MFCQEEGVLRCVEWQDRILEAADTKTKFFASTTAKR